MSLDKSETINTFYVFHCCMFQVNVYYGHVMTMDWPNSTIMCVVVHVSVVIQERIVKIKIKNIKVGHNYHIPSVRNDLSSIVTTKISIIKKNSEERVRVIHHYVLCYIDKMQADISIRDLLAKLTKLLVFVKNCVV